MKILLSLILVTLIFIAYNLYTGNLTPQTSDLNKAPSESLLVDSPTPPPSPTDNPHPDWLSYTHPTLGFTISYPSNFKIVEDNYGWPKAVFMLYSGGQSYDLVIEKWDSLNEYQAKYPSSDNSILVNGPDYTYSLLNNNNQPIVDDIISTFNI